jgi:hypothetical protein
MDVLTFFANPSVRDIGAIAILAIVVVMILRGDLVPRRTHDRELAAADRRTTDAVARGDEWKATAKATEEVNAVIRSQNSDLIEANKIVKSFLQASGPSIADTSGGV